MQKTLSHFAERVTCMLGIQHFEIFLIAGIILNLTPGPNTIYILSRSIAQGKRTGRMTKFLRENRTASAMTNKLCGIIYLGLGVKLLLTEK